MLMQWSAYIFQTRRKPCVMPVVCGAPGSVKSAIFGTNQTGKGPYMRIYGAHGYKLNDIESLLQKHNTAGMNKLYCCLEEATAYRKSHRNSDKLKDIIDSSTQRIEPKGVDDFEVNDHRAFSSCTNDADAYRGEQGDRRLFALYADPHFSNLAVQKGRIDAAERDAFCAKFNTVKNSDEVAYALFEYGMLMDLEAFTVHLPPVTEMLADLMDHTKCAVREFLVAVRTREWGCGDPEFDDEERVVLRWTDVTPTRLYERFRAWKAATDIETPVASKVSLGKAIVRYVHGAPQCVEPLITRREGRSHTTLYSIELDPP